MRNAMSKQPIYIAIMQARNFIALAVLFLLPIALVRLAQWPLPLAIMVTGGAGMVFVLGWNFVWVNTVVFRLTKEEVEP